MKLLTSGLMLIRRTADDPDGNFPVFKPMPFGEVSIETSFETICIGRMLDALQGIDFVDAVSKRKVFGIAELRVLATVADH